MWTFRSAALVLRRQFWAEHRRIRSGGPSTTLPHLSLRLPMLRLFAPFLRGEHMNTLRESQCLSYDAACWQ